MALPCSASDIAESSLGKECVAIKSWEEEKIFVTGRASFNGD
ncbi:hypothetical protein A2U01_0092194, partial [Trifolium medium]|nr:hypothetical protein [Trifolium medium]